MAEKGFKRKLAAILSADVEGYSRLMDDDEKATVRTLTSYRKNKLSLVYESLCEHIVLNQDIRDTRHRSTIQGMKRGGQL